MEISQAGTWRRRHCAVVVSCLASLFVVIALLGCAAARPKVTNPEVGPFTRAVLLFYEFESLNPDPDSVQSSDALSWITLERGKPKTISVVPFDENDRWLSLDRRQSLWVWKSSDNVQVQRTTDGPTARVTMTGGDTGWLQVWSAGFGGDIKLLREGYRVR